MRIFGQRITIPKIRRKIASMMGREVVYRPKPRRDETYVENPNIERMVFICGVHRSGTTLLERLLTTRYEVAYLRAYVPASEGQHMQSVFKAGTIYGGPGKFAFSQKMIDDLKAMTDYEAYREQITADWSRFVVGDYPLLLEKSPSHMCKMWWLRQVFPGCKFIIMTRDPRAVSAATDKWSKTSLPELMMHWNAAYSIAMDDYLEEDCTIIRYEDLVERPEAEIDRLAAFIECAPRTIEGELEERHSEFRNSNQKYFEEHTVIRYGEGMWNKFGYEV